MFKKATMCSIGKQVILLFSPGSIELSYHNIVSYITLR